MLSPVLPRMERRANIAFLNRVSPRLLLFALIAASLSVMSVPLVAQDVQAAPKIEDMIPDSAVKDADSWAKQTIPVAQAPPARDDTPPDQVLTLPDPTADLPPVTPLTSDDTAQSADAAPVQNAAAQPVIADARLITISKELTLAFPHDEALFPVQAAFVDRFKSLSTIQTLAKDGNNIAQLAARAREDEKLLQSLLQVYGYYNGQVIRSVASGRRSGAAPSVRFDIVPGARYHFGKIDLGQLDKAPDYPALRSTFKIETGDPLSSDVIVEQQSNLGTALGESGYPFAQIGEPELLIDHDRIEGDLTLDVQPKGKYVFGEVVSDKPRFLSGKHLQTIARFEPGEAFKRSLILDLRRAITATGLVSTVLVKPREVTPPTASQPGVVAVDVALSRAPLRTISGAIGYGTEEGVRVQASWENRNLFPPEGSLKVRGIVGTQEQLAGVTFRKNNFGGRDRILTVDTYASTVKNNAFDAQTVALVATYERVSNLLFQKPFSWGFGPEILATYERPIAINGVLEPRQAYLIAGLSAHALLDSTDDLLDPAKGFRLGGMLSPEVSRTMGTQSFYLRSQFDASYYRQVTQKVVLAGRIRLGSIPGTALDDIAPSQRFYAGGGSSVRGYGYQSIGPFDASGNPTGGRSLAEFSLEARVKTGLMGGAVSVVPFFDAGTVGVDPMPDFKTIRYGAGIGIRYYTDFGPIRVDVGTPINPGPNDSRIAVYVSLGQAF